jgi:hypothetical protein
MSETLTSVWGPLSEPIHTDPLPEGRPAFRDNAFLGFWDHGGQVFGAVHVSTSPNSEGRRARFSLSVGGRATEIVEPLEPYSFGSPSIAFDLDRRRGARGTGDRPVGRVLVPMAGSGGRP